MMILSKQIRKVPMRPSNMLELYILYTGCFGFSSTISYVKYNLIESDVLHRYFKFLIEFQTELSLALTLVVLIMHYQTITRSNVEINCRILVGDQKIFLKMRYAIVCMILLSTTLIITLAIHSLTRMETTHIYQLFQILAIYILVSTLLLGGK